MNMYVQYDECTWKFNRAVAREAHRVGFTVLEREEIERRYLFKMNSNYAMHLNAPAPQIVGTSLLSLISCLARNGSNTKVNKFFQFVIYLFLNILISADQTISLTLILTHSLSSLDQLKIQKIIIKDLEKSRLLKNKCAHFSK